MLIAQVIETEPQAVDQPRPVVIRSSRRLPVRDRGELGCERLHHAEPAKRLVTLDGKMDRVTPVRKTAQHRLEIAEVRVVPPEEEDLHRVSSPRIIRRTALMARRDGFFSTRE